MENEILTIEQYVICPVHGIVKVKAVNPNILRYELYILSCGDIHPIGVFATTAIAS